MIIRAKRTRKNLDIKPDSGFSTRTMINIAPLPKTHQAKVLKKINEEKLAPSKIEINYN